MNIETIGKLLLVWCIILAIITITATIADYKRLTTPQTREEKEDEQI